MKKIAYYLTYYPIFVWMYLHALLPFKALYILSDILYILVYKLIGYRLKVVRKNLANSFPDKSKEELMRIEKEFYHHFCDYFVETIKLLHISDDTMRKRLEFKNLETVQQVFDNGNSVLLFLGHYCNWEWVPSLKLYYSSDMALGQIYKPLKNKAFDDIFLKIRSRFGSFGIPKNSTLREIIRLRKEGKQQMIGFMADQVPSINNIHYWTNFLNQDTAVFTGVERIAKQTGFVVVYLDLQKVKRGYYKGEMKILSEDPKSEPEFAITERYMREIEHSINRQPAYWLWTHKRWKKKREEVARDQAKHNVQKRG